ncbi:MAG: hypothetical protein ACKVHL_11425 [Rhodospirillales bacterium]|jgi:uncharacterized paraquat-inducible protein A
MTKAGKHKAGKHKKPTPIQKNDKKVRNCLMCQDSFMSEWSGERVCRKCKSKSEWRSSSTMAI